MKKLMIAAVTAILSAAVFADEPAQGANEVEKKPGRQLRMREGGFGMRAREGGMGMRSREGGFGMAGGAINDPIVRAVMNPKVAEGIGLSDEQKAKLAEFKGGRGANRELQKKVGEGMKRQMELLQAETIDEAAVMASIDEVFEVRKQMAKEQTKRLIAIRSVLTPEQIKKARELMNEKRAAEKSKRK